MVTQASNNEARIIAVLFCSNRRAFGVLRRDSIQRQTLVRSRFSANIMLSGSAQHYCEDAAASTIYMVSRKPNKAFSTCVGLPFTSPQSTKLQCRWYQTTTNSTECVVPGEMELSDVAFITRKEKPLPSVSSRGF